MERARERERDRGSDTPPEARKTKNYNNHRRGHSENGDGREMGPKRQRITAKGSSSYKLQHDGPPLFPVVRLGGVPFECREADIAGFLDGRHILDTVLDDTGAYCLFDSPSQVESALGRKRRYMGSRYVEVFRSSKEEYYRAIVSRFSTGSFLSTSATNGSCIEPEHTGILRMTGLPYSASNADIVSYFRDFAVPEDKVHVSYTSEGTPSGEAFVEFADPRQSKAAMCKNWMVIGSRFIELLPSNRQQMDESIARGREKVDDDDEARAVAHTGVLRMGDLPYYTRREHIVDMFRDIGVAEEKIHINLEADGTATGEGYVEFAGPGESNAALAKDRMIRGRRIQLFPSTRREMDEAVAEGEGSSPTSSPY